MDQKFRNKLRYERRFARGPKGKNKKPFIFVAPKPVSPLPKSLGGAFRLLDREFLIGGEYHVSRNISADGFRKLLAQKQELPT